MSQIGFCPECGSTELYGAGSVGQCKYIDISHLEIKPGQQVVKGDESEIGEAHFDHGEKEFDQKKRQVGGNHYLDMPIQPFDIIEANGLGFFQGNIIKYVMRYPKKNGLEDLRKAQHCLERLIEIEEKKEKCEKCPK